MRFISLLHVPSIRLRPFASAVLRPRCCSAECVASLLGPRGNKFLGDRHANTVHFPPRPPTAPLPPHLSPRNEHARPAAVAASAELLGQLRQVVGRAIPCRAYAAFLPTILALSLPQESPSSHPHSYALILHRRCLIDQTQSVCAENPS